MKQLILVSMVMYYKMSINYTFEIINIYRLKLNSCHFGKNVNNPLWGWKKKSFFYNLCGGFDVGVG
jgi:hypothetical protein